MNDFLNNLRNRKNENQQVVTRKFQNKADYHTVQKFHSNLDVKTKSFQNLKRPLMDKFNGNQQSADNVICSQLVDAIENLNATIETLLQNQKFLVRTQKKTADMAERQAIAIEKIVDNLDAIPKQFNI